MTTAIVVHEVEDGKVWANAWASGPGSRHELFEKIGVTARTFRDPEDHNMTGLLLEIPDMDAFRNLLDSEEGQKAMAEDGLKVESLRMLAEFQP